MPALRLRTAPVAAFVLVAAVSARAEDSSPAPAPGPADAPVGAPAPAAVAVDALPFAEFVDRVHVGEPATVGRSVVLLLWAVGDAEHPIASPGAWVGIEGSSATLTELPEPIGDAAVRVTNTLDVPLYVPRGEAVVPLPGSGFTRVVDRPVWIAAGGAAYVPVVQPTGVPSRAPYRPSADRASPETLRALRLGTWEAAVLQTNQSLGVEAVRQSDALAGYDSPAFARSLEPLTDSLEAAREALAGPAVGIATVDERGLATLILEGDAARFRAQWAALSRGVVLDAAVREARNAPPIPPAVAVKAVEEVIAALDELRDDPAVRPAFGKGEQVRWPKDDARSHWIGLVVDEKPIAATFHRRDDVPVPPRPGGPAPGRPPPREPPPKPPPGGTELDRRGPRNPFEERLKERRDAAMGG